MASDHLLLGGDFNCVMDAWDSTGHGSYSLSLSKLIRGYTVRYAWQDRPCNTACTHYTVHGTARLDIFLSNGGTLATENSVATAVAALTEYFGMILRLFVDAFLLRRGRGTWKLRNDTLTSTHAIEDLQHHWTQWKKTSVSQNNLMVVSPLQQAATPEVSAHRGGTQARPPAMKKTSITAVYMPLCAQQMETLAPPLLCAKILQMHAKRVQSSVTDTAPADNIPGETPTFYQLIRGHKRRSSRMVRRHVDTGTIQTSVTGIASEFTPFFPTQIPSHLPRYRVFCCPRKTVSRGSTTRYGL
jgi:hypothetical protein